MPDYNLSGLSPRSFEQLVQAIAAKVIGPGVIIFGDGPDGGREATFEGQIPYPFETGGWNGYGVVQAKFRQTPKGPHEDAGWLATQLKAELQKFGSKKRGLRKPDFYILASNIVLSPKCDGGGKEKIEAVLIEYKEKLQIRDFRIWDYDQIRVYIDAYQDIRMAYSAWIQPGDVLSAVIKSVQSKPDFETAIVNLLQKELLSDQYVKLEQAGHVSEDRTALARVFVDLPVSKEPHPESRSDAAGRRKKKMGSFIRDMIAIGNQKLDATNVDILFKRQQELGKAAEPPPGRYVLIGGPGQGKTTVGQFLAQLYRTALLKEKKHLAPEIRQVLRTIQEQCSEEKLELPSVPRFPIRIVLNHLAAELASGRNSSAKNLVGYILGTIRGRTGVDIPVEDFRKLLSCYPWLIVLDGLDEVPASSNRGEVLAAIQEFWVDLYESNADVLVLATTRPQGYSEEFSPDYYNHHWLAPLSPKDALRYAQRLVNARYAGDEEKKQEIIQRLTRATKEDSTARLMTTPLQVTIMATLLAQIGQPPQERWRLFQFYYQVIYRRELERGIPASRLLREYNPDIDSIHRRVGLVVQIESEMAGMTDARLSIAQLMKVIDGRLSEEQHDAKTRSDLAQEIVQAATERLVFIVGVEANKAGFEIRSLQEFMAAEALMDGTDEQVQARLRLIAPVPFWRNVFLFAAGKCFAERQHLRDTVHTICAELNESPGSESAALILAGSQVALDLLEDGSMRKQPKYLHLFARLALRLLDLPSLDIGAALSSVYDKSLRSIYEEEIRKRIALPIERSLGAWALLLALVDRDRAWEGIADACWPSEVSEQGLILEQGLGRYTFDGDRVSQWSLQKAISHASQASLRNEWASALVPRKGDKRKIFPEWALALDSLTESQMHLIKLRASGKVKDGTALGLRFVGDSTYMKKLAGLRTCPDSDNSWLLLRCAAEFADNPTKANLARQLECLANSMNGEGAAAWPRKFLVPWPFLMLVADGNKEDILEKARRVSAGEFGDYEDWIAAEKRWQKEGVTADDLVRAAEREGREGSAIATTGFAGLSSVAIRSSVWSASVLEAYRRAKAGNGKRRLAVWLMSSFRYMESDEHVDGKISVSDIASIVDDVRGLGLNIHVHVLLLLLTLHGTAADERLQVVNQIGLIGLVRAYGPNLDARRISVLGDWLKNAVLSNPSLEGVLVCLGGLVLAGASVDLPAHILEPERYQNAGAKAATIIIRLANWKAHEWNPEELAKEAIVLSDKYRVLISDVLSLVRRVPIRGLRVEKFLTAAFTGIMEENFQDRSLMILAIEDVIGRNRSELADFPNWNKAGLPPQLHSVLQGP